MNTRIWLGSWAAALLLLSACGPKVTIPPKVDLRKYNAVGLIGFRCNAEGNMDEFLTRRFLLMVRSHQKEAHIVQLGSEQEVLKSVGMEWLDSEAIRAIGLKYSVDAVLSGNLEITEITPLFKLYRGGARPIRGKSQVKGTRASADTKIWVSARLWEPKDGATVWRVSERGEGLVDQVSVIADDHVIFDARDPHKAFWKLIRPLVKKITADFRTKL